MSDKDVTSRDMAPTQLGGLEAKLIFLTITFTPAHFIKISSLMDGLASDIHAESYGRG